MPGRLDIEEKSAGATALRAVGTGCALAAGALLIAAVSGLSPAIDLGSVGVASWLGMGCWLADALQDTALLAGAERKRRADAERDREDAALLKLEQEMAARDGARPQTPAETPQEPTHLFVALIERQRENEARAPAGASEAERIGRGRDSDGPGETGTGYLLGSAVLRAMGQGLMIATLGFGMAALLGSSSEMASLGAIVTTGAIGSGCFFASAALWNAERERRRADREEPAQSIGTVPLALSRGPCVEQDAVVCADLQADHVARLARERQVRQAGHGPCV